MSMFHFRRDKGRKVAKEPIPDASRKYHLPPGRCYVVEEAPPKICFEAFSNLLSAPDEGGHAMAGLAVTRQHPDLLIEKYGLGHATIYWLATRAGERVIAPTNLGILAHTITKFVQDSRHGVVLLDGIEYLVSNNDFHKVLRMVDQVNDHILQSTSRLILPVDPRAFDQKELALLERSMERMDAGSHSG